MSPLDVRECPADIAERAVAHPDCAEQFTERRFLEVARRYFDVAAYGHSGQRPLHLMRKRPT